MKQPSAVVVIGLD